MGLQIITCVETNKKNQSDNIYIKEAMEYYYEIDNSYHKLSTVYMNGKGNYSSAKVKNQIYELKNQYQKASKNNRSIVMFCFDCDEYDIDPVDIRFLKEAKEFCRKNDHLFVWFCRNIEHVFWGYKVSSGEKCKEASMFKRKKMIKNFDDNKLREKRYKDHHSNLLLVLDDYLQRRNYC